MQVLSLIFIVFSVSCAFAKPYEYSYYISTPGHYQSLAVKDGAAIVNGINPNIRQGRGPGFNPSNPLDRRYPSNGLDLNGVNEQGLNVGLNGVRPVFNPNERYPQNGPDFRRRMDGEVGPNFRQGRVGPAFNPNERYPQNGPYFRRRMDGEVGPNFRQGRVGPGFNPNERYPVDEPDFRRGTDEEFDGFNPSNIPNRRYPDFRRGSEDSPDGELDPLFNQGDQRRRFPNSEQNPRFNQIGPYSPNQNNPEFGRRIRPLMSQYSEQTKDREELTTSAPCSFCGIDKVNSRDGINETDPDSETVEPRNGSIQNNAATPSNVVLPFNSPVIPYYVVVSDSF